MYVVSTKITDSYCALRWVTASLSVFVCLAFLSASSISIEQFSTAIKSSLFWIINHWQVKAKEIASRVSYSLQMLAPMMYLISTYICQCLVIHKTIADFGILLDQYGSFILCKFFKINFLLFCPGPQFSCLWSTCSTSCISEDVALQCKSVHKGTNSPVAEMEREGYCIIQISIAGQCMRCILRVSLCTYVLQ